LSQLSPAAYPLGLKKCGHPADLISNFDQAKAEIGVRERQISSDSIRCSL